MASSSFAMEDARRHLRKEEFDLIYPPGNSTGKGPRRVPLASMHGGDRRARGAIDYYEYYPKCVRSYFPQRRVGNMIILHERNDHIYITCGPHWPGVGAVVLMLLGGAHMNYHEVQSSQSLQTFVIVMLILSLFFLAMTACTDPGIIRSSPIGLDEESADQFSFCDICNVHRPLRAIHCMDCNCCIDEMDHHCPWMGKCIGKKNMKWFILFNLSWLTFLVEFIVQIWLGR